VYVFLGTTKSKGKFYLENPKWKENLQEQGIQGEHLSDVSLTLTLYKANIHKIGN
jgi:hypothetical protein